MPGAPGAVTAAIVSVTVQPEGSPSRAVTATALPAQPVAATSVPQATVVAVERDAKRPRFSLDSLARPDPTSSAPAMQSRMASLLQEVRARVLRPACVIRASEPSR